MTKPLFITGLLSILLFSCKQKKEETVTPVISPITEAVFAPGHIEAENQFTLTAMNDGYIKEVRVKEGDNVHPNEVLMMQDNTTAVIQQQTATENLHIAEQQASANSAILQQLQAQLDAANDKLSNDKTQLERLQRLYTTHSVAKMEVDNARLSYDNSLNNVKSIQKNIAATKLNLQQTVVNSRGQQQTAAASNSYYNIKSPGNYKVYTVLKKKGELVRKGEAVAILGNANQLTIVMNIDETSIAKIKEQQTVLIELNTQKGKTYTAKISRVLPSFDVTSQSYTAEARFDTAAANIINGTLLQANIIVAKKEKSMLIPRSCLGPDGKVWIKKNNRTDTIAIHTGIISNEWVEVLSGITINDKIIKQ